MVPVFLSAAVVVVIAGEDPPSILFNTIRALQCLHKNFQNYIKFIIYASKYLFAAHKLCSELSR